MIEAVSRDPDMPAQAWREAAEDLTITVVAPYELLDEAGHIAAVAVAWVESFGSAQGTVVAGLRSDRATVQSAARWQGMFYSLINEESYALYDRDLFMATLNDWAGLATRLTLPPGTRASRGPNDDEPRSGRTGRSRLALGDA
jgi:hypothetical protein